MALSIKHEAFVQAACIELLPLADAYLKAGYKANTRDNASKNASALMKKPEIQRRIEEIQNDKLKTAQKTSISTLHEAAVKKAEQLLNGDNAYVASGMIKTILERSEPVVKQTQSIQVHISSKDKDKRSAILERKRQQIKAIETVDSTRETMLPPSS